MHTLTIRQIKEKISEFSKEDLEQLRNDERKGVQKVIEKYETQQQKSQQLQEQFNDMMKFERDGYQQGKHLIAGIDEAGRGPLAGPVVAGAVIIPKSFYLKGINDSKKLSPATRERFFTYIKQEAYWAVGIVSNDEIDRLNIYQATKLAMKRAVENLKKRPDHLLIDAMDLDEGCSQEILIKGDQKSVSIAAASIVAKVTRDQLMADIDKNYPMYNFKSNQGYGTKYHLEALQKYGATPYHRKSFAPVKQSS